MEGNNRNYDKRIDQLLSMILSNPDYNVTIFVDDGTNSPADNKECVINTLYQDSDTGESINLIYPSGSTIRDSMAHCMATTNFAPLGFRMINLMENGCQKDPAFEGDEDHEITADEVFRAIGIRDMDADSKLKEGCAMMHSLPTGNLFNAPDSLLARKVERLIHSSNPKSKKIASMIRIENDLLRRNIYAMAGGYRSIVCGINEMIMHLNMLEREVSAMRTQLNPPKTEETKETEQTDQPTPPKAKSSRSTKPKASRGSSKQGRKAGKKEKQDVAPIETTEAHDGAASNPHEPMTQETKDTTEAE